MSDSTWTAGKEYLKQSKVDNSETQANKSKGRNPAKQAKAKLVTVNQKCKKNRRARLYLNINKHKGISGLLNNIAGYCSENCE